jgi:hypothetical protein
MSNFSRRVKSQNEKRKDRNNKRAMRAKDCVSDTVDYKVDHIDLKKKTTSCDEF